MHPPKNHLVHTMQKFLQEAGVDVRDMTRCYSGLHFMNTDDLDQALRDTQTHEVSEVLEGGGHPGALSKSNWSLKIEPKSPGIHPKVPFY